MADGEESVKRKVGDMLSDSIVFFILTDSLDDTDSMHYSLRLRNKVKKLPELKIGKGI